MTYIMSLYFQFQFFVYFIIWGAAAFKFYGIFKENSADLSGYSVMDKKVYLLKTILILYVLWIFYLAEK